MQRYDFLKTVRVIIICYDEIVFTITSMTHKACKGTSSVNRMFTSNHLSTLKLITRITLKRNSVPAGKLCFNKYGQELAREIETFSG